MPKIRYFIAAKTLEIGLTLPTLSCAISSTSIFGFPSILIISFPYTSPTLIGASIGLLYSREDFINCIWSKDKVETIFFEETKFTLGLFPSHTSTSTITWFSSTSNFWLVCEKAQLIRLEASFNLDLELFVPLITVVIRLLSLLAVAAIPQPEALVKPVFKPSAPWTEDNNLFLLGCLISL